MKLYYYDHCPFCTRARMIFGFHNLAVSTEVLANDDEETPNKLIGKKMLPILIKEDGTAMGESLDIVRYINDRAAQPLDEQVRPELEALLDQLGKTSHYLVIPRTTKIDYPEFAEPSARAYYDKKKAEMIGDFAEHLARTESYLEDIKPTLEELDRLILKSDAAKGKAPSMEDILLFPVLRGLSTVKGIAFPAHTRDYLENISKQTGIPLMFDQAV